MLDVHFEHLLLVDSRGGVTAVTAAPSLAWILPVCGPATVGLYEDSILVMSRLKPIAGPWRYSPLVNSPRWQLP